MNLLLTNTDEFMAVLEALTQYVDNAADVEARDMSATLKARLAAAEKLREKLETVLVRSLEVA